MVLQLDNVDGLENLQPEWASHLPVVRRYTPAIERWRSEVEAQMPDSLRRRSDAAQLVDKYLWTMSGENSAGDPTIFHDGGNGYGLMADRVSRTPPGTPPGAQIKNAWDLVANNPNKWTDWGEGSSYQGKAFGALGVIAPYDPNPDRQPIGGGAVQGGTYSAEPSDPTIGAANNATVLGAAYDPNQSVIDKLRAAREKRLAEAGYIPGSGTIAGTVIGGAFGQEPTPEERQYRAVTGVQELLGPGIGGSVRSVLGGSAGAVSDVFGSLSGLGGGGDGQDQGQGTPMGIDEVMQRAGLNGGLLGNEPLGGLTRDIPGAGAVTGAVSSIGNEGIPGTGVIGRTIANPVNFVPGVGLLGQGINAVREGARQLGGPDLPGAGNALASQIPTTPLDIALQAGPGNVIGAGKGILGGLRGEVSAGANIIGDAASVARRAKQAKAMYEALTGQGHTEAEIVGMLGQDAVNLAKGGTAAVRAVEAQTPLTTVMQSRAARNAYNTVLKDTGSAEMATEAARKAAGAEAGATSGLRTRAQQMADRMVRSPDRGAVDEAARIRDAMGPGVVGIAGDTGRAAARSPEEISTLLRSTPPVKGSFDEVIEPQKGFLYRGLSGAEAKDAIETGVIKSKPGMLEGSGDRGFTWWNADRPDYTYVSGSYRDPALIVEIPTPSSAIVREGAGARNYVSLSEGDMPLTKASRIFALEMGHPEGPHATEITSLFKPEKLRRTDIANTGKELRNTAGQLSERMGPGVVGEGDDPLKRMMRGVTEPREVPPQPRLPDSGQYPAVRTDDGSIFFDTAGSGSTHFAFMERAKIPPERVESTGWLVDGDYRAAQNGVTDQMIRRAKAIMRVNEMGPAIVDNAANAAQDTGSALSREAAASAERTVSGEVGGKVPTPLADSLSPEGIAKASREFDQTATAVERNRAVIGKDYPETAAEQAAVLADEARKLDRQGYTPKPTDTIGDIATIAKRLGDPASEIRRQLQQGGGEPDTGPGVSRKAPNFGTERQPASERIKSKSGMGEVALRRGPELDNAARELADGLAVDPNAIGLPSKEALSQVKPKNPNSLEAGRNAAHEDAWRIIDSSPNPADVVNEMSYAYMYRKVSTPRDRAFVDEMQRLQEGLLDFSGGTTALNWEATRMPGARPAGIDARDFWVERLRQANAAAVESNRAALDEGLQMAAGKAPQDIADVATTGGNVFTDAAAAERQAAQRATEAEQRAERLAVQTHQSKVEAMDLERRKQAWVASQAKEAAMAEAQGYHQGGIGKEIVGALGLPRALSLSADIGTARDLGLFVGTREGRQAAARGGLAGIRSVVHNDADAREVIDAANKGSRWFEWASKGENLPGQRPFHAYDFGAGASSASRVPEMASLNESSISKAVEKLPWVGFSDRALAVQRNVAGVDLLESRLNELALKYGVSGPEDAAKNARFLSEAQSTIDSVNHLRGYSGGAKAKALGALSFLTSPQQLLSRLQVLGDPINFAIRGDMESAKFAASSLAGFATSQGALLALARVTGGPGRWSVNLNPTSSDFGTIKIGNTRYDTMAGLGPTMRLVAKIGAEGSDQVFSTDYAKNQAAIGVLVTRWLANKEQPVSRMVTDFMQYNKLPDEQTAINMLAPSLATGFMQNLAEERGANKLLAAPNAALNFGGVGVNTYKLPGDVANETAQQTYGRAYDDLTKEERIATILKAPADAQKTLVREEKSRFVEDRKQQGYMDYMTADEKRRYYEAHPEHELQAWAFEDRAFTSVDTADRALALGVDDPKHPIRYSGIGRPLNASEDTKKAWADSKDVMQWYDKDLMSPDTLDQTARRMYKDDYAKLSGDQQGNVRGNIHATALKADPEADAWMYWWGRIQKPNSNRATAFVENTIYPKYGYDADYFNTAQDEVARKLTGKDWDKLSAAEQAPVRAELEKRAKNGDKRAKAFLDSISASKR